MIATIQLIIALVLRHEYDPSDLSVPGQPAVSHRFWTTGFAATLHSKTVALVRGPRKGQRVVWDI